MTLVVVRVLNTRSAAPCGEKAPEVLSAADGGAIAPWDCVDELKLSLFWLLIVTKSFSVEGDSGWILIR